MELRKTMLGLVLSIIKIGAVSYIGLLLLVFFKQSGFVYYPDKLVGLTPSYYGMAYEDIKLRTGDGEDIAAWFVPSKASPGGGGKDGANAGDERSVNTVLFCHGNGGDIGDRLDSIKTFHDLGLNVLIFDYRGYGESSGKPTEEGTYLDAMAAWNYLTAERGIPGGNIMVFGRSLGGSVAVQLAGQVAPGVLVVESTFTSAPDMAAKMFPILPVRLVCRFKYDSLARISEVGCPVLIAHSRDDDMIPYEHGRRLFEAAVEPKIFVEMTGLHNAGGLDGDRGYQKVLEEFLNQHLEKSVGL